MRLYLTTIPYHLVAVLVLLAAVAISRNFRIKPVKNTLVAELVLI